jgi:type IV secretory pathway VirB2 component (pilin)
MNKRLGSTLILGMAIFLFYLMPELSFAQVAGFDSKVNSLTNLIVGKILPAVAVFGLIYAAILAAAGDESSKRRMVLVIIASIVGILAKFIIPMFQGAV